MKSKQTTGQLEGDLPPEDDDDAPTPHDETPIGDPPVDDREFMGMDTAPKDRIIDGQLQDGSIIPIRWRSSRRRENHQWVESGVWHPADTAGACQVKPVGWRPWVRAHYYIPEGSASPELDTVA